MDKMKKAHHTTEFRPRQPVGLAISAGRRYQSGQTGFVHHNYSPYDAETADTIPVYENLLWSLALLRTRVMDSMQEGKALIGKILHFQSDPDGPNAGSFPIYLHQYPVGRDRHLGVHLLAPLYWIVHDFGSVLGEELNSGIDRAVKILLSSCQRTLEESDLSYLHSVQYSATMLAWARLLEDKPEADAAERKLERLRQQGIDSSWCSSQTLGQLLSVLVMVYPDLSKSPWDLFWDYLGKTWHRQSCSYVGPALEERQRGLEPQPSVYDLFMGHYSGCYSYRSFDMHPFQLQAALIPRLEVKLQAIEYPLIEASKVGEEKFLLVHHEAWAYTVLEQKNIPEPTWQRRHHPFRLIWGSRTRTHSCVMQGGNAQAIDFKMVEPNLLELCLDLCDPEASRDSTKDLAFFVDDHDLLKKSVAGKPSTTFQLGEEVTLEADDLTLRLVVQAEALDKDDADNQLFGCIHPGNRPAQTSLRGADRFKAFDNSVFIRSVRRSKPLRLKVRFGISDS